MTSFQVPESIPGFVTAIKTWATGAFAAIGHTHSNASASTSGTGGSAGFISAADQEKLDGIAAGAQVNSITGVKGNAELSYRTGDVNLTPANIGAVAKSGDTMTGNLLIRKYYPNLYLYGDAGELVRIANNPTDGRLGLIQYVPSSNYQIYENYILPAPNVATSTQYAILTSKNAVTISQGGTGATDAAGARTNLGAATHLVIYDTTLAGIYNKLTTLRNEETANCNIGETTAALLTGNGNSTGAKVTEYVQGIVMRYGTTKYSFFCKSTDGQRAYGWISTLASGSSCVTDTVYRYSGTAL